MRKTVLLIVSFLSFTFSKDLFSQNITSDSVKNSNELKFKYSSLIIPAVFISYGFIGMDNDRLRGIDAEVKEELNENIDERATLDDFTQYAPMVSVYALNALGVNGKNRFKNRTIILATSYVIMGATVTSIKSMAKIRRPDGSSRNSFPSGHTATAFMGAEFLWQEFKDVSIWYGLTGYAVAAGTGFFRMYNNRHWLTDVSAGAGIGMLSTKVAYWINPYINRKLFKSKKNSSAIIYPYYNGKQSGLSFSICF